MSSFALNADNDLDITNNELTLTVDHEAIRQHLLVKFQLFLGEYFLDITAGVPWYQDVLLKNPNFVVVSEVLKGTIVSTQGVIEILSFELDFDAPARVFSLAFTALTEEGVISFNEPITI